MKSDEPFQKINNNKINKVLKKKNLLCDILIYFSREPTKHFYTSNNFGIAFAVERDFSFV